MAQNVLQTFPASYNGRQLQASDLSLAIAGFYFPWISELEYSDTCEVQEGRGLSPYAMGTTTGEYKANGSITVHLAYRKQFMEIIAGQAGQVAAVEGLGKAGRSFMDISFGVKCQYQFRALPGAPDFPIITDQVLGCRITGGGVTISAGNGVLVEKFPLYVGLIIRDGFIPVSGLTL